MASKQGDPIWYELMTSDADAAQAFYGPLLGWTYESMGTGMSDYRIASKNGVNVGGIASLTDEMTAGGARPMWAVYYGVDDVDASTEKARSAGGAVHIPPTDIPGVGRFAFLADPGGAMFYIMKGSTEDGESEVFAKYAPREGHCAWNELYSTDPETAKSFYSGLFGWTKDGEMDMGPMGKYEFLRAGDYGLGAVMRKPDEFPAPMWVLYFRVPAIDDAVAQVKASGGQVLLEPQEIPGGDFVIQGIDPQGALFALVGKR